MQHCDVIVDWIMGKNPRPRTWNSHLFTQLTVCAFVGVYIYYSNSGDVPTTYGKWVLWFIRVLCMHYAILLSDCKYCFIDWFEWF